MSASTSDDKKKLDTVFKRAVELINAKPVPGQPAAKTDNKTKLTFYALYKTATEGNRPANAKQPSRLDVLNYYKYIAWGKCDKMSQETAKHKYIKWCKNTMPPATWAELEKTIQEQGFTVRMD